MLKIENLSAGILRHIHLHVSKGECVAVVGQSGSGKTTLLNSIAGYLDYQGHITLAQQPIDNLAPWQRHCRYLNQRLYLFPHKTVSGNLRDRYPHQLSGGEQQRAALARALINPPDLLLLDEPFSSLDWETKQHIWAILKDLMQSYHMTTLLVTHDPKEADYLSHRQIRLHQGQLI
ncbi:ABC transporter ATP-binding protein [Pasteurella multocida]